LQLYAMEGESMGSALSILLATVVSFVSFISGQGAQGDAAWDGEAWEQAVNGRFPVVSQLPGQILPPRSDITWDPVFEEAWDKIEDANGFHMAKAAGLMPDPFYYARWQKKVAPRLLDGLGDRWLDKAMYYHEQDNTLLKTVYRVAGAAVKMPESLYVEAVPLEDDPDDYEFVGVFSYADGSTVAVKTGTTLNTSTGRLGGENGFGNLGYNYFVDDNLLESTPGNWQRGLGYTKLYDDLLLTSGTMTNIDTVRITFTHDGMDWLLQLWKGRYLNMPGGEIGLYHKPRSRPVGFYDTIGDDELIGMSFKLTDKRNGKLLINRPMELRWWTAGFAIYDKPLEGRDLAMETTLAPRDDALLAAMKAALDEAAAKGELSYTTLNSAFGPAVRIKW